MVIAEREVRQLIVVQSQLVYICLSMCNAQECNKTLQYQDMNCYLYHYILWYKMIMGFQVA